MDSEDEDFYSGEAMDDDNDYYNTDDAACAYGYDDEDDDDDDDDYEFLEEADEDIIGRQQVWFVEFLGCGSNLLFFSWESKGF